MTKIFKAGDLIYFRDPMTYSRKIGTIIKTYRHESGYGKNKKERLLYCILSQANEIIILDSRKKSIKGV